MIVRYLNKILVSAFLLIASFSFAQIDIGNDIPDIDYSLPQSYVIGGITVSGVQFLDNSVLISLSGLRVGDKIQVPGEKISRAIQKLWDQGLFEDARIEITRIQGEQVFLNISLVERPRLARYSLSGVRKGETEDLRDKIKLTRGDVITDNLIVRTKSILKKHYIGKGFFDVEVDVTQQRDSVRPNEAVLAINIKKNQRVRISDITFEGNRAFSSASLKASMKKTKERGIYRMIYIVQEALSGGFTHLITGKLKQYPDYVMDLVDENFRFRVFKASKFIDDDYLEDKDNIVKKYNNNGYRDAVLLSDSVYRTGPSRIGIHFKINEGSKFYYRDIKFVGNTKYTAEELALLFGITKGDVFKQDQLEAALNFNPNGIDLSSLFVDDGYLTCQIDPVETRVENDSIDLEIRIREGKQMSINHVVVNGNTRTNDHVIIRELTSKPGELFSRSDIIRSRSSLGQLRYFDEQKIDITTPNIDPSNGTVDIEYKVEETSSDQLELSGGWGYGRLIGTLGVSFNNFSARNLLKKDAWKPIPSGDGQKLTLRVQSYGTGYLSASGSFTEPWLGGKKPQQFSVSSYISKYKNTYYNYSYQITGLSFVFSRRLNWPDNYFTLSNSINLQQYKLANYPLKGISGTGNGLYQNYSYSVSLGRYSLEQPLYPRSGSEVNFSLELTPPYSLIAPDWYSKRADDDKYRMIEYHQWKFSGAWYKQIVGDLVLMARTKAGFLGKYNMDADVTPFNRYFMGGDGMTGMSAIDGRQLVGFRGYKNETMTPDYYKYNSSPPGATIFTKNTLELRYPLSLNPQSTIYGLVFLEAGNAWEKFKDFSPFNVKRSAGVGVRVFLPMFGLLGLDWGYGFDNIPGVTDANKGQFHFSINSSID